MANKDIDEMRRNFESSRIPQTPPNPYVQQAQPGNTLNQAQRPPVNTWKDGVRSVMGDVNKHVGEHLNPGKLMQGNLGKYVPSLTGGLAKVAPYALPMIGGMSQSAMQGATPSHNVQLSNNQYGEGLDQLGQMLEAKKLLLGKTGLEKMALSIGSAGARRIGSGVRKFMGESTEGIMGAPARRATRNLAQDAGSVAMGMPDANNILRRAPMLPHHSVPTPPPAPTPTMPNANYGFSDQVGHLTGQEYKIPTQDLGTHYFPPPPPKQPYGLFRSALNGGVAGTADALSGWVRPVARIPASAARIISGPRVGVDDTGKAIRTRWHRAGRLFDTAAYGTTDGANWLHNKGNELLINTGRYGYAANKHQRGGLVAPKFRRAFNYDGPTKLDKYGNKVIEGTGKGGTLGNMATWGARKIAPVGDSLLGAGALLSAGSVAADAAGYGDTPWSHMLSTGADKTDTLFNKIPWAPYASPFTTTVMKGGPYMGKVIDDSGIIDEGKERIYDYAKNDIIYPLAQEEINNAIRDHDSELSWLQAPGTKSIREPLIGGLKGYMSELTNGGVNLDALDQYNQEATPEQTASRIAAFERRQQQQQPQQQPAQQQPAQQQQAPPTPTLNTNILNRSPEVDDNEYEETGWGR
ncbi:MAG: hypothetical protein RR382_01010 [Tannerellaceae bacterium]